MKKIISYGHLPGDLVLIPPSVKKSANQMAQSIVRARKASFTHIAIIADPTSIIHAMPDEGVCFARINEVLSPGKSIGYRVLRHVDLDIDMSLVMRLRNRMLFYLGQKYNFSFFLRRRERSSYCSELAAKVYKDIGYPLCKKLPRNTLPVDIENLLHNPHWLDVTSLYVRIHDVEKIEICIPGSDKLLENAGMQIHEIEELIHKSHHVLLKGQKTLNTLNRIIGLPEETIELPREYWDVDPKDKS